MKVQIKITEKILIASMRCGIPDAWADYSCQHIANSHNCAIALALRELFPNACVSTETIFVFNDSVDLKEHESASMTIPESIMLVTAMIPLTLEMRVFITLFDQTPIQYRPRMAERTFELPIPDTLIERIGIQEVNSILSKSETLSLVN